MKEFNLLSVPEQAQWLYDSARDASKLGDHAVAQGYLIQSLNLFRGLDDKGGTARCLVELGQMLGWPGSKDFHSRRSMGEEALVLFREMGDHSGIARALAMMASSCQPDEAVTLLLEGLKHVEIAADRAGQAAVLSKLANRALKSGESARAREYSQRALRLARESDDKAALAQTLFSTTLLLWDDVAVREASLLEARNLFRELGDEHSESRALGMLAFTLYPDGDARAEPYLSEALKNERHRGHLPGIANCLMRLATIERARGEIEKAETLESESRAAYVLPEPDAEFVAAILSGDPQKVHEAMGGSAPPNPIAGPATAP